MPLKPRWVHPLNFRAQDKETLDAALQIAKKDGTNLTEIIRIALKEYAEKHGLEACATKMDSFLEKNPALKPEYLEILTPALLKAWSDGEVLGFARQVRARRQEIEAELRRRGYRFEWG